MRKQQKNRQNVYLGHGPAMEQAAGLRIDPAQYLKIGGNLAAERGYFARDNGNIGRILNPTEMFVIYSAGHPPQLFCMKRDANSSLPPKPEEMFQYTCEELQEYLRKDIGSDGRVISDHVVVTTNGLVGKIAAEIRALGFEPVDFQ